MSDYPILYGKAMNKSMYGKYPGYILVDALSCEVVEELNGVYELELTYPYDGRHIERIEARSIIVAKTKPSAQTKHIPDSLEPDVGASPYPFQPFRVYKISKNLDGTVTVYAGHISYDLSYLVAKQAYGQGPYNALIALKKAITSSCDFDFIADFSTNTSVNTVYPRSVKDILVGTDEIIEVNNGVSPIKNSFFMAYGCEFEYDLYKVLLTMRRGSDKGYTVRYGKNLISAAQENLYTNVYTGIIPYYYDTYRNQVTLSNGNGIVYVPNGDLLAARYIAVDLTEKFDVEPTETQLRTAAEEYIASHDMINPEVSLTVDFIHEASLPGYDLPEPDTLEMGDTVHVVCEKYGISADLRVVKTYYDVLSGRYTKVELGNPARLISDRIGDLTYSNGVLTSATAKLWKKGGTT